MGVIIFYALRNKKLQPHFEVVLRPYKNQSFSTFEIIDARGVSGKLELSFFTYDCKGGSEKIFFTQSFEFQMEGEFPMNPHVFPKGEKVGLIAQVVSEAHQIPPIQVCLNIPEDNMAITFEPNQVLEKGVLVNI